MRTWLLYEGRVRRVVHRLEGPAHEDVSPVPGHLPDAWRSAGAFHLAPMPFAVQRAWLAALARAESPLVSIDPHLPMTRDTLDIWKEALAETDASLGRQHLLAPAPRGETPSTAAGTCFNCSDVGRESV